MTVRHLDALFHPQNLMVLGAPADAPAAELVKQLELLPKAQRVWLGNRRRGWRNVKRIAEAGPFELAVVLDADAIDPDLTLQLAAQGCRALIWIAEQAVPEAVLRAGSSNTLRVLGPRTSGVAHARGIGASAWGTTAPGTTALIAQSRSIAGAALDWAAGHSLGFSWTAVTGDEADIDVADLLDYAALDAHTQAVVLQLSQVRSARKFMSAARACARAKPVIVLQTLSPDRTLALPQDPLRSAAFRRAGLVEVDRVTALFSAIAALDRVGEARAGRIAVVGTGAGICQLARASLLREGLTPCAPIVAVMAQLQAHAARTQAHHDIVDLGLSDDRETIEALRVILASAEIDTVLYVRSPAPGSDDDAFVARLIASELRKRLVVAFMGQARAAPALSRCAEAGIAAFASVEAASRALRHRRDHRRTQELLMRTPTLNPLVHGPARLQFPRPAGAGPVWALSPRHAETLLNDYGLRMSPDGDRSERGLKVQIARDPELGLHLQVRLDPSSPVAPTGYALPPLDDRLAEVLLREAALDPDDGAPPSLRIRNYATAVARLAQMAAEYPQIEALNVRLVARDALADIGRAEMQVTDVRIPDRQRLALAPYPAQFSQTLTLRDDNEYRIRVIRPTDEPALITMLTAVDPEMIRLRFFRYIRHFTHAMAARITQIDYDREMTFIAQPVGRDEIVAAATLISDADGAVAEFAILVHHHGAGIGLGRRMMEILLSYAGARGIGRVVGDVLLENTAMLGLAQRLGFSRERHPDDPTCVRIAIAPTVVGAPPWPIPSAD